MKSRSLTQFTNTVSLLNMALVAKTNFEEVPHLEVSKYSISCPLFRHIGLHLVSYLPKEGHVTVL